MGDSTPRVNFGRYLEKARISHDATIEEVAAGICDPSLITKIESGERVSSMLLRNRLLERIGTTSEEYETYVKTSEYGRWKKRRNIIFDIENGKYSEAEGKLEEYRNSIGDDQLLEEQFCLEIKAMLASLQKNKKKADYARLALEKTVTLEKNGLVKASRLAPREINLIIEYAVGLDRERRKEQLEYLLKIAEEKKIDERNLVLFYPKLVCSYVSEFIEDNKMEALWLSNALYRADKAEKILFTTGRLIYCVELTEIKKKIWENLFDFKGSKETAIFVPFSEGQKENDSKNALLMDLERTYDVEMTTKNWCYLYQEEGVKCVGDIIRKRRKMIGMSKEELCVDICSLDTLDRIEKLNGNPKTQKMLQLLERLGLEGEFQKTNISVADAEIKECEELIMRLSNTGKYTEALQEFDRLDQIIACKTDEDRQFILMGKAMVLYRNGEVTVQECNEMLRQALAYTLKHYDLQDEFYMTRSEMSCIYNIVMLKSGQVDDDMAEFVSKVCDACSSDNAERDVRMLELYLLAAVMIELKKKNGEQAEWYNNRLIKMELQSKRRILLYQALNNNISIYNLRKETGIDIAENVILQNRKLIQELKPYRQNQRANKPTNKQTNIYELAAGLKNDK